MESKEEYFGQLFLFLTFWIFFLFQIAERYAENGVVSIERNAQNALKVKFFQRLFI